MSMTHLQAHLLTRIMLWFGSPGEKVDYVLGHLRGGRGRAYK